MNYKIVKLVDKPEMKEQAAQWFHEKWGIPLEAYLESMEQCLNRVNPVPQWYMAKVRVTEKDLEDYDIEECTAILEAYMEFVDELKMNPN